MALRQMSEDEFCERGGRYTPDRDEYPEATPQPCSECPWRRVAGVGWLGPYSAEDWLEVIHGESPIACHQTITETNVEGVGDWEHPSMRQCRGAAIFRRHVGKTPRNPSIATGPEDPEHVFGSNQEFLDYHHGVRRATPPDPNAYFPDPEGAAFRKENDR